MEKVINLASDNTAGVAPKILSSLTEAATISMPIYDIVHFEKQKDESKKVGLVIDFAKEPDAMDIVLGLTIQDETLTIH